MVERDGRLDVGVVYVPPSDDVYAAVRGEGAYRNGEATVAYPVVASNGRIHGDLIDLVT